MDSFLVNGLYAIIPLMRARGGAIAGGGNLTSRSPTYIYNIGMER